MSATITVAGVSVVIGGNEETIEGTEGDEWILGTDSDDIIAALAGNDLVYGEDGNDSVEGGDGDDGILGGEGDDTLYGGAGNDALRGDAGADNYFFDPSEGGEDDDIVVDFSTEDGDKIALSAAGILRADPNTELSGAGLDASELYSISDSNALPEDGETDPAQEEDGDGTEKEVGDVVINHPGGTITLTGVEYSEDLTFAALEEAGLLEIAGAIEGAGVIEGTDEDDVIVGSDGEDSIAGKGGDDFLTGGDNAGDEFEFNPDNEDEGDDIITDFTLLAGIGGADFDQISLTSEEVLAAAEDDPAIPGEDAVFNLDDLDASENWTIGTSDNGWLLLTHPGGSIEFNDIEQGTLSSFNDLRDFILVDGATIPEDGIPVDGVEPPEPEVPVEPEEPVAGGESDALII